MLSASLRNSSMMRDRKVEIRWPHKPETPMRLRLPLPPFKQKWCCARPVPEKTPFDSVKGLYCEVSQLAVNSAVNGSYAGSNPALAAKPSSPCRLERRTNRWSCRQRPYRLLARSFGSQPKGPRSILGRDTKKLSPVRPLAKSLRFHRRESGA